MKNRVMKILALVIAVMTILGTFAVPASAYTTYRQPTYTEANDLYWYTNTYLGLGDHPINAAIGNTYTALKYGRDNSKSYFYDSLNNKTYYANGVVIDGEPINTSHWDGTSYWDGQYWWHWDASSGYYYRLDQWGNNIWGSRSGGTSTGGGTGYNYTYCGKSLFPSGNGVITGIDSYVNYNQATMLANMIWLSGKNEASQTKQAGIGWSVLFCAGGPSNLTDQWLKSTYSWYKPENVTSYIDSSGRDVLALAKDIIFRWQAWKSGTCTRWGGVLEETVDGERNVYLTTVENSGTTIIHKNKNVVTDYTFPHKSDSNSIYYSPYNT